MARLPENNNWLTVETMYYSLPPLARELHNAGAIFTGGVVSYLIGRHDYFSDIDMIIPRWRYLQHVMKALQPYNVEPKLTKFGGMRFEFEGTQYDVWVANLDDYLMAEGKKDKPYWVLDYLGKKFIQSWNMGGL